VSLCITSIVSDFGLIVIERGLHCVDYCLTVGQDIVSGCLDVHPSSNIVL